MWTVQGLNLRPSACDADALPSELTVQKLACLGPAARTTDMPCGARHSSGSLMLARALRPTPRGVPTHIVWALPAVLGALCNGGNRTFPLTCACLRKRPHQWRYLGGGHHRSSRARRAPADSWLSAISRCALEMTGATRGCGSGPALPNRLGRIAPELLGALP